MNLQTDDLALRLQRVRAKIAEAADQSGRSPDDVTLVAVSKSFPAEHVAEAFAAGQRVFGENRVQEGAAKVHALQGLNGISWHLIGHLQTNKVKVAAQSFALLQSVDSVRLASRLSEQAAELGRGIPVLLQVNVAGEASKTGFSVDWLRQDVGRLTGLEGIELRGLMTIAPLVSRPDDVRWVFRTLRELRDELRDEIVSAGFGELSMGMSGDFRIAIEEGATIVRVGRAIFGERPL